MPTFTKTYDGTNPIVLDWHEPGTNDQPSFHLVTKGTLAGAWAVEVSNADDKSDPADITSQFTSPGLVPVVAGAASTKQFLQFPSGQQLRAKAIRFKFTPTAGAANDATFCHVRV